MPQVWTYAVPAAYDLESHERIKQMGRPLNKKYFGLAANEGIGGEGITSLTVGGTNNNYTANPTISSIAAPNLPGGIQAVGEVTSMTVKAVSSVGGTTTAAYLVGDTLTYTRSGDSAVATFTVATLAATSTIASVTIAGTAGELTVTSGTYFKGQSIRIVGVLTNGAITGYNSAGTTYYIMANVTGGTAIQITDTYANAITGTANLSTTADASPIAATSTLNGGTGSGAQRAAGPVATVTIASAGTFPVTTALQTGARATTSSGSGAGATVTLAYGILAATVTTGGSGYTTAPAVTLSGGNGTLTAVLSSVTPNTIAVSAFIPGGASAKTADAVKQASSTRYRVTTADGTGVCSLVAAAPAEGEMNILALDTSGGEYYVTKLTSRRCTIVQKTGVQFENDVSVGWNISAAEEGTVVKIVTN